MDTVKKTCLFSMGFYALWLTEFVPSNLIPKTPWKFISEIECHEKVICAAANHLGQVTLDASNYLCAAHHLDVIMKQWLPSFWWTLTSTFCNVIHWTTADLIGEVLTIAIIWWGFSNALWCSELTCFPCSMLNSQNLIDYNSCHHSAKNLTSFCTCMCN